LLEDGRAHEEYSGGDHNPAKEGRAQTALDFTWFECDEKVTDELERGHAPDHPMDFLDQLLF